MLASPEQLAVDHEARHPEHTVRFRGATDCADCLAKRLCLCGEVRVVRTGLGQYTADDGDVLDVQRALPEALEHDVMVAAEHRVAMLLGIQHASSRQCRVPDFLWSADDQAA